MKGVQGIGLKKVFTCKKKTEIDNSIKPTEVKQVVNEKKALEKIPLENKVLANMQDLKNKVKIMSSRNISREQITSILKSHGITMDQINKAIEVPFASPFHLKETINASVK